MSGGGVQIGKIGGLWHAARPVHRELRPFVRSCAGFWEAEAASPYRVRLVPSPNAIVMISLAEPFNDFRRLGTTDLGPGTGTIGSLIAGLHDGPRACEHPGDKEAIRLEFTPLGAYRLFAVPMAELTNQVVELHDVLGSDARDLVERLAATQAWAARFDLLEAALLARLDSGLAPAPEVAEAWRLLSRAGGVLPIARIAADVGWSHGQLIRRFSQQVGLTPKMAARVMRFDRALGMLAWRAGTIADVSAACGYYDQAHLSREFSALAGTSPSLMMAARTEEGDFAL